MTIDPGFLKMLASTPLEELAPLCEQIAQRLYSFRRENSGFTPTEVFEQCLGIGGVTASVEVAPLIRQGVSRPAFALRKRNAPDELSWRDQFNIPGAMARQNVAHVDLLNRVAREISGPGANLAAIEPLSFAGVAIYNEPTRLATCWSLVYTTTLKDLSSLDPKADWKFASSVEDFDTFQIADLNKKTLEWLWQPNRPIVADLRLHREADWLKFQ